MAGQDEATVVLEVAKPFLPWAEFNYGPNHLAVDVGYGMAQGSEPGWTLLDYYAAGLEVWARVSPAVIITASRRRIENRDLYGLLNERKPPLVRIIGGFKTSDYIPGTVPFDRDSYDFADPAAWQLMAQHARVLVSETGTNVVVLENETATEPYHYDGAEIDYERSTESLVALAETGIEFWWFLPRILADTPEFPNRQQETTRFVTAIIDALPQSKFLTTYTGASGWQGRDFIERHRDAMIDLVGLSRMNELLYVTSDGFYGGRYYYTPREAAAEMVLTSSEAGLNIVYPGAANWVVVGQELAQMRPPLADIVSGW